MLKVLDKPIVQHWIERFSGLGVKHITIVTGHFPEQVRAFVGNGERWGLESVQYVSTSPLADWDEVIEVVGEARGTAYAALNAFPQRSPASLSHSRFYWTSNGMRTGYERVYELNSIRDFWAINLETLETCTDPFEPEALYRINPHAIVDPGVRRLGRGVIERGASIADQVTLQDSVVGERVQIGRGCTIVRSVLIDGSTAASHLAVENMVVDGGLVYSVDHDTLLEVDDVEILSGETAHAPDTPGIFERLLALLLLLFTAPRRVFPLDQNGPSAHLHKLKQVVRGSARLFGLRRTGESLPNWASDQREKAEGVISLADITAGVEASIEEVAAINAYQINHFTTLDYFKLTGLWFGYLFRRTS
jgi:hypothetical protein